MEMRLRCKVTGTVLKKDEKSLDYINKQPIANYFVVVPSKWEITEEWYKELKLRCILCGTIIDPKIEKPLDHIKKHPTADLFDAVAIPKWE